MSLSLDAARTLVDAAIAAATERGLSMSVSVVDVAGNPVAAARMDGALWVTARIAESKAVASATFGRPSAEVMGRGLDPVMFKTIEDLAGRSLMPGDGALPVVVGGVLAGALGVSGGSAELDVEVGQAALAALAVRSDQPSETA